MRFVGPALFTHLIKGYVCGQLGNAIIYKLGQNINVIIIVVHIHFNDLRNLS